MLAAIIALSVGLLAVAFLLLRRQHVVGGWRSTAAALLLAIAVCGLTLALFLALEGGFRSSFYGFIEYLVRKPFAA